MSGNHRALDPLNPKIASSGFNLQPHSAESARKLNSGSSSRDWMCCMFCSSNIRPHIATPVNVIFNMQRTVNACMVYRLQPLAAY